MVTNLAYPNNTKSLADQLPLVSVGVPVYNGENYLRRALNSLLAQDYPNLEIVICDNASTDSTSQICAEYAARDARIHIERQPENFGATKNFNRAFELTTGKFFMWLAHDDWLEPNFISCCLQVLTKDSNVAVCYPSWQKIDNDGTPWGKPRRSASLRTSRPLMRWRYTLRHWPIHAAIYGLMRREMVARTRGILDCWSSDLVFVSELSLQGQIATLPDVLSHQREPRASWEKSDHQLMLAHMGSSIRLPALIRWYVFQHILAGLKKAQIPVLLQILLRIDSTLFYVFSRFWQHDVKELLKRHLHTHVASR